MKRIFLFVLIVFTISIAQTKEINGFAEYSFGDDETIVSAKEKCKKMAIVNAVSSFATYIKSETEIKDFMVQSEIILAKSAALTRNINVLEEKIDRQKSVVFYKIKAEIDEKEVIDELKKMSSLTMAKTGKEVNYSELVERDSIFYMINKSKPFTGAAIEYFGDNKTIKTVREIRNGKLHGKVTNYFLSNGNVEAFINFIMGKKHGKQVVYYENGQVKALSDFRDDKIHGGVIAYYENGKVKAKPNFVMGELHGESIEYYENGKVEAISNFVMGKLHGEQVQYYENGQVKEILNYKEDKLHGEQIKYYENGQTRGKWNYINGVEQK